MRPRRQTRLDRFGILSIAVLLGALAAVPADAAGSVSCSLTATPLAFGGYAPSSNVPTDVTATITVTCTATGATAVPLQGSIALIGATSPHGRQLTAEMDTLRYHTYLDPARTMFWGDGTGRDGTEQVTGVVGAGTPFRRAYTVYGRILARQTSADAGTYADHITAILNY
jgi:spore coat protein U-like protein